MTNSYIVLYNTAVPVLEIGSGETCLYFFVIVKPNILSYLCCDESHCKHLASYKIRLLWEGFSAPKGLKSWLLSQFPDFAQGTIESL